VKTIRSYSVTAVLAVACMLLAAPAAFAGDPTSREYPYLYKSSRAMGMGGAYTAIGGRVDAVFSNPATLINIPRDKGWDVNLLNLNVTVGKDAKQFFKDMQDALDVTDQNGDGSTGDEELKAMNDVLARYTGENLHLSVSDLTALGKSYDSFAFAVGGVGVGRLDAMPHQGFGSDGLLEVNADVTYGAVVGFSVKATDNLFAGLGVKALHRESLVHKFTAQELVDKQDNLDNYIQDELRKKGSAVGFDAGLLWNLGPDSYWRPSAGLSVLNIGDLDFKEAGKIPMTVNAGLAVNPQITWSRSLIIGIDYIDILNNYTQDKDMLKRTRMGAELQLFDILPVEMSLRAGLYQGSLTFGADLRLLTFLLSYTQYTEQIGAYAGQDKDTRQMLTFNFGW